MPDQRSLTFGMNFDIQKAIDQTEQLSDSIEDIKEEMIGTEQESDEMGSRISDNARKAGTSLKAVGTQAGSMGEAIIKSAEMGMKATNSMGSTIKAGMQGAFGYAEKRFLTFEKNLTSKMKKMGTAIKHPVQTIKDGLAGALEKARESIDKVGEESDRTKDKIKDTGKEGENAGTSIKDAIAGAAGKLVALKAGFEILKKGFELAKQFAASIYEAGKNADTLNAKFGAVFADDSGMQQWSENFAKGINRSTTEVQQFLVSNKAMYEGLGITGDAANSLSKVTTSLAYDMGAAFKMDDAEALAVMQDYIGGNTNALAEYGIQIDDVALKQTALQMGIRKNLDELTDAEAAQVRMNALLEAGTSIQKKAADGELGYANGTKAVKAKLTELKEQISAKFEPVFSDLVGKLLEAWPKIEPPLMQFFGVLGSALATAGPALMDVATTSLPPLIETFSQLFTAAQPILSVIGALAATVLPVFGSIIGKLAQTVMPPLNKVISMLYEYGIKPLMPVIEKIAEAVMPLIETGLNAIIPILETVLPILEPICTIIGKIVEFLGKIVSYAASGIGDVISKVAGFFGGSSGEAMGTTIPHNAGGTNNFIGGWTHINERGGELAYLPRGSTIVPADKSKQIMESVAGNSRRDVQVNLNMQVEIQGNADQKVLDELVERVEKAVDEAARKAIKEEQDKQNNRIAIQEGYA